MIGKRFFEEIMNKRGFESFTLAIFLWLLNYIAGGKNHHNVLPVVYVAMGATIMIGVVIMFGRVLLEKIIFLICKIGGYIKNIDGKLLSLCIIIIPISILLFVGWQLNQKSKFADLLMSLFSDSIGLLFTTLIIDTIVKNAAEKRRKPIVLAMHREIQLFTSRFIALWARLYKNSISDTKVSVCELFSEEATNEIIHNIKVFEEAKGTTSANWMDYIIVSYRDLSGRSEKILDRYMAEMEPSLFQAIYYLSNETSLLGYMELIENVNYIYQMKGWEKPELLGSYIPAVKEKDCEYVKIIVEWCNRIYKELDGENNGLYFLQDKV